MTDSENKRLRNAAGINRRSPRMAFYDYDKLRKRGEFLEKRKLEISVPYIRG